MSAEINRPGSSDAAGGPPAGEERRRWGGCGPLGLGLAVLLLVVGLVAAIVGQGRHGSAPASALPAPGKPLTAAQAQSYAGSAACAPCHRAEYAKWQGTNHQKTLRVVDPHVDGIHFGGRTVLKDPAHGLSYRPQRQGEALSIHVASAEGPQTDLPIHLAMGSGRAATTYMPWDAEQGSCNLRLSFFAEHGWRWTPKQGPHDEIITPIGMPVPPARATECFRCHMTRMVVRNEQLQLPESELGIGCERCHGPGKEHIALAVAGTLRTQGMHLLPAADTRSGCTPCHSAPVAPTQPELDLEVARFKATSFELSACRRDREATFTCVSCHDPHSALEHTAARYDAACAKCHSAAEAPCKAGKTSNCARCHMPEVHAPPGSLITATDHWIRAFPQRPGEQRVTNRAPRRP